MLKIIIIIVYIVLNYIMFRLLEFNIKRSKRKIMAILFATILTIPSAVLVVLHLLLKRLFD